MGLKEFQIVCKLGEGSFSSVWKVKRISDGQEYAMKKVKMASLSEKEKQNALNEVRILASIKNPYIIGYKEAFFEDNSMTLCIVMEYAAGGDIYNKIAQHQKSRTYFKEEDIWNYAIQMIIGLKTLHDMKILHRDLKSANIFLSKDGKSIKLGDLNVSKVAKTNLVYTQTGTPYYASPEVWRDQPYDMKSDIWSLGCVIYEICALKPPFRANDMQGLFRKVQKGVFDRIPSQYSSDLNSLVSMCLQVSPSLRPTCDKFLNHQLIIKHGKDFIQNLDQIIGDNELLGTIKLPRNIKSLADKLPKPNYAEEVRSEEFEKGSLNKLEENERDLYSRRGKRAYSQQTPKGLEEKVIVQKPPSRHYRVPSRQKVDISNDHSDERYQQQRLHSEKPRPLRERSPKIENDENSKAPSYKVVPRKKVGESIEGNIIRKRVIQPIDLKEELNLKALRENIENIDQNIKNEKLKINLKEKNLIPIDGGYDKAYQNQAYNNNKYSNIDQVQNEKYKALEKIHSDREDLISKKAENIVRKYYADAALAEKREPLAEINRVNVTPGNVVGRDAIDILERYNNIYNLREPSSRISSNRRVVQPGAYQRNDYPEQHLNNYAYKDYLRNDYHADNNLSYLRQQQEQQRGVVRPSWWG
jgi:NIMA (never in mitosis gene a)-related kinase